METKKKKLSSEKLAVTLGVTGGLLKRLVREKFFKDAPRAATIFVKDARGLEQVRKAPEGDLVVENVFAASSTEFCEAVVGRTGRTLGFCYDRAGWRAAWPGAFVVRPGALRLRGRKELVKAELGDRVSPAILDYLMVAFRGDPDEVVHFVQREAPHGKLLDVPEGVGIEAKFAIADRLLKTRERTTFLTTVSVLGELALHGGVPEAREAIQFADALYHRLAELRLGSAPPSGASEEGKNAVETYLSYRDGQVRALARTLTPHDLLALREVAWQGA